MGNKFSFIHCADLHLGARFVGIMDDDPQLGGRMRDSVKESFSRIIDAGLDREVDFMVISGDLYDDTNVQPSIRLFLCNELKRFGRPVYIARGNHDPESPWDKAIPYPENVHEFPIIQHHYVMNIRGSMVDVTGISFCESHDRRNLVSMISGIEGRFSIAVVHCDIETTDGDSDYAPFSIGDTVGKGVDYWALGHIHKREVISDNPYVVYPGNIQGRSIKETGEKGAYIVSVTDGAVDSMEFIATQSISWEVVHVDVTGKGLDQVLDEVCGALNPDKAVRLVFEGHGECNVALRKNLDDILTVISERTGCIMAGATVDTTGTIDPDSLIGGSDMRSKIVGICRDLKGDRRRILDTIATNAMAGKNMGFFESLTDEELYELVEDSMMSVLSDMEASR